MVLSRRETKKKKKAPKRRLDDVRLKRIALRLLILLSLWLSLWDNSRGRRGNRIFCCLLRVWLILAASSSPGVNETGAANCECFSADN